MVKLIREDYPPDDDPIYQEPWTIWVPQGIEYSKEPGEASTGITDSTPGESPNEIPTTNQAQEPQNTGNQGQGKLPNTGVEAKPKIN